VTESAVREAVATAGLDPDIAFLHASHPGRQALIFDLMEPVRPLADRIVIQLVEERVFAPGDMVLSEGGVCRLQPELARYLVSSSSLDAVASSATRRFVELIQSP
jgi:CRISPR-associated protein Cas1